MKYASLAKNLKVQFIRILEPRAAGKSAGQKVYLENRQLEILSEFATRLNTDAIYKDFPIIVFFGNYQRKSGCFGAGNRYIYVDPNGDAHACTVCRGKMGNLLEESFDKIIEKSKSCRLSFVRTSKLNPLIL